MKTYPICESLSQNPAKHCAALVVTKNVVINTNEWPSFAQPSEELRNGTLTFVKTGDHVYGVTCWHVIEHFRNQLQLSGDSYSHSMRTMVNGFYVVLDRFKKPGPPFGESPIDIAIREVDPDFLNAIGKTPIDLDAQIDIPADIQHGYAVGFPEALKYKTMEDQVGYRISMPQVEILAELDGKPSRRFTLFSELKKRPEQTDYSGMSGGPIFWSTENNYGIFGIIYAGGIGSELSDGKAVYVFGEAATPRTIKSWIAQIKA